MISWKIKQQIIDQTDIVEAVGEVVKLTKKGNNYFGLCPFHNDNHPSMSVSNKVKMFNCFSCGTKGNVIEFFKKYQNITEDQATIMLAKRLGIEISEATSKKALEEERLLKVMQSATAFYQFYLNNTEEGIVAKKYLHDRGLDDEIIKTFGIGLAPNEKDNLHLALNSNKHLEGDQIDLGLVKLDKDNTPYDVFKHRIMFPLENNEGKTVGFSGRIYTKSNEPKYVNSAENVIFHKGQILYNLHRAIPAIREHNKVILFEGFMDVIAAYRANIPYGIATMGTALTNDHIKAILGLTKNIILCFDGDSAGLNAMRRSAMLLANFNIIPKAIVLPDNLDPDEYVKAYGTTALAKFFNNNEKNVYQCLYELAKKNLIKGDIESMTAFKNEVFTNIRFSKESTIIEHYLKELSLDLDVPIEALRSELGQINYQVHPNEASFDYDQNYNHNLEKNQPVIKVKQVKIKRKVFTAFDVLLKHMIFSKSKFLNFINQMGNLFFFDHSLTIYFELIKQMEIYYAENETMNIDQFIVLADDLDHLSSATNTEHHDLALKIINNPLANVNDLTEFKQCLTTVLDSWQELTNTKLYNKAVSSGSNEDIKEFEKVLKKNVKKKSKEEK